MDIFVLVTQAAQNSKYILLFIIYLFAGPVGNFVSSVLASDGILDIWVVYILIILAELIGDILYYVLGRYIPIGWIDRKMEKHEDHGMLKELNNALVSHPFLALTIIKATPMFAGLGLLTIGRKKYLSWKRFIPTTLLISLVKNTAITFLGYETGIQLEKFKMIYSSYTYTMVFVVTVILLYFAIRINRKKIEKFMTGKMKDLGKKS